VAYWSATGSLSTDNIKAQTVIPQSKVKDVLAKLDDRPSGGYLGVIMTLDKVR
jgi:hypothetical protein